MAPLMTKSGRRGECKPVTSRYYRYAFIADKTFHSMHSPQRVLIPGLVKSGVRGPNHISFLRLYGDPDVGVI